MLDIGDSAATFSLSGLRGRRWSFPEDAAGKPALLVFFETDCRTCQLTIPYLNRLFEVLRDQANVIGISQDAEPRTASLTARLPITFPVLLDEGLVVTRQFDPQAVPTLFLLRPDGVVARTQSGFDKSDLNAIASDLSRMTGVDPFIIAEPFDGAPERKMGCVSRHLERMGEGESADSLDLYSTRSARASRIVLEDSIDPYEYCAEKFNDPLPVVPPTLERVERMLSHAQLAPDEVIARIPPNYGAATVEKIAANAVMAGRVPEMMRVQVPLLSQRAQRENREGGSENDRRKAGYSLQLSAVRCRSGNRRDLPRARKDTRSRWVHEAVRARISSRKYGRCGAAL